MTECHLVHLQLGLFFSAMIIFPSAFFDQYIKAWMVHGQCRFSWS